MKTTRTVLFILFFFTVFSAGTLLAEQQIPKANIEKWLQKLSDPDPEVRLKAAKFLGKASRFKEKIEPYLIMTLNDKEERVRTYAAISLVYLGIKAPNILPILISAIDTKDASVERDCMFALMRLGPGASPALFPMIDKLESGSHEKRLLAVMVLKSMGPGAKKAVPALIETLDDPYREVRIEAKEAIKKISPEDLPKDADEKTKKAKSRRRDEALAKLKKGKYKIEKLIADLNKTDSKKKEAAIKILGDIGPDAHQAVSDLCRIMKEGDANAEAALIQIGKPAVPALIEMLSDENPQARKQAAFILGQIGPEAKEAIPALRKALDDTDIDVKSAAFSALDEIGWE